MLLPFAKRAILHSTVIQTPVGSSFHQTWPILSNLRKKILNVELKQEGTGNAFRGHARPMLHTRLTRQLPVRVAASINGFQVAQLPFES
jgi:hypothetical protein